MKDCNGHGEVEASCDVEAKCVADAMEQLQIFGISIRDRNRRRLFFNFKRDLRHSEDFLCTLLLHNLLTESFLHEV